jgi:hypothetical protein
MNNIELLISKIKLLDKDASNYVVEFEEILSKFVLLRDYRSIKFLINLLDDECDYDELMFSIIHTVEDFEEVVYAREIGENISSVFLKAPEWAKLVLIRILNSPSSSNAFRDVINNLPKNERMEVVTILEVIKDENSDFVNKVMAILSGMQ